ncbi:MAG: helix-turn-helix transcriptional regulator [Clostridia bacterium]|jgi:transcriptional regulator with XRE-family HTH domain|nr:helix-turn-helix transcriptional regulator [Clostridia bacterium]
MTLNEALAARINELLQEKNITQYGLFKRSGVSAQEISQIRHQRNKSNSLNIVFQLAQGFEMSLMQFFDSPLFGYENVAD